MGGGSATGARANVLSGQLAGRASANWHTPLEHLRDLVGEDDRLAHDDDEDEGADDDPGRQGEPAEGERYRHRRAPGVAPGEALDGDGGDGRGEEGQADEGGDGEGDGLEDPQVDPVRV